MRPELFWLFIKLIGVGIGLLVVRSYIEKIAAYLQFRWHKDLNVGVKVFVRGQEGIIDRYNISSIFIKTKDRTIIVNMRRWLYEGFALMHHNIEQ